MNGVVKGGRYGLEAYWNRSGFKLSTTRVEGRNIGFRFVKGVPRGSSMVTRAQYTRSAGWRNTDYLRRVVVDRVGFRCEWCTQGWRT